jgi:hypothetical protein
MKAIRKILLLFLLFFCLSTAFSQSAFYDGFDALTSWQYYVQYVGSFVGSPTITTYPTATPSNGKMPVYGQFISNGNPPYWSHRFDGFYRAFNFEAGKTYRLKFQYYVNEFYNNSGCANYSTQVSAVVGSSFNASNVPAGGSTIYSNTVINSGSYATFNGDFLYTATSASSYISFTIYNDCSGYGTGNINASSTVYFDFVQICETPSATISQNYQYCTSGPAATLTASETYATSYLWSTGATSQSIQSTGGSYWAKGIYTVPGGLTCESAQSPTYNVQTFSTTYQPYVQGSSLPICPDQTTPLIVTDGAWNELSFPAYQWSTGATTASIDASPGDYFVNVLTIPSGSSNYCWVTSHPKRVKLNTNISCLARERSPATPQTIGDVSLQVYPNPASEELKISFAKPLEFKNRIEIVDSFGRSMHHSVVDVGTTETIISTETFKNGLYVVVLKENLFTKTFKVVITH